MQGLLRGRWRCFVLRDIRLFWISEDWRQCHRLWNWLNLWKSVRERGLFWIRDWQWCGADLITTNENILITHKELRFTLFKIDAKRTRCHWMSMFDLPGMHILQSTTRLHSFCTIRSDSTADQFRDRPHTFIPRMWTNIGQTEIFHSEMTNFVVIKGMFQMSSHHWSNVGILIRSDMPWWF